MYNQQGEYDKAQPLYERALAIWEAAYGPNHPDVAHTLTDLAVLHLEQVQMQLQFKPLRLSAQPRLYMTMFSAMGTHVHGPQHGVHCLCMMSVMLYGSDGLPL